MWGWGQLATGDRRGWLLPPLQLALIALLAAIGPPLAMGTAVGMAFLLGVAFLAAWATIALHAYRRAVRRRALFELPAQDGGALVLLWFAPMAIVAASLFWGLTGRSADPGSVVDRYVDDWRNGRAAEAIGLFVGPPADSGSVTEAWQRQSTALRNELVRLAAQEPGDSGIDADAALETIRWVDLGDDGAGGRRIGIEVARRETVRGQLFGLLPTTSQRLVTLARLGSAELRAVPMAGSPVPNATWRLVRVDVMGIALAARE